MEFDLKPAVLSMFVQYVLPVLFSAIAMVGTWALARFAEKLGAEAKTSKTFAVLERLSLMAHAVVADLEVTLKPRLLEATRDGVLTQAEIVMLRSAALERLKQLAGERGLEEARALLGIAAPELERFLTGLLERAVDSLPSRAKVLGKGELQAGLAVPR